MVEQAAEILHYSQSGSGAPLVILHGLFGSSKNWQSLAKQFAESFTVYNVDLRNHGSSFHNAEMNYVVMADDVSRLLEQLGIQSCHLIGHSMGGKVAMTLAASQPGLIARMIVADIAPVTYSRNYNSLIDPIMAISLADINSRSEVDRALAPGITDPMLRGFLLQNLHREGDNWRWRVNWTSIKQYMTELFGFPLAPDDWHINVPTLFMRGENSDYVDADGVAMIESHFSQAEIETLPEAGHWLHADKPQVFMQSAMAYLHKNSLD